MSLPDWWSSPLSRPPSKSGEEPQPEKRPAEEPHAEESHTEESHPEKFQPGGLQAGEPHGESSATAPVVESPPEVAPIHPADLAAQLAGEVPAEPETAPPQTEQPETTTDGPVPPNAAHAELVVYGATSAGVMAAVAAARHGVQVLLLEPGRNVGGMTSGGLGYTDLGDQRVIGGLARMYWHAVADHYGAGPGRYAGPEPHVAEQIFERRLEELGVDVRFDVQLAAVHVTDGTITSLEDTRSITYQAGVFVDASYEGDLLAAAGVPYAVGRESRSTYRETFAGRREPAPGKHQFPPFISPFDGSVAGETILPWIHERPVAAIGEGDGGVMAYGFRVCLTRSKARLPFPRRDGYDPADWELARRYLRWFAENDRTPRAADFLGLVPNLPGDKCDANSIGPFSLNLLDGTNWAYPEASPAERERIRERHLAYTQDFLYFLSSDPDVPKQVREDLQEWGLPPDEFTATAGFPHQLYVREARRMTGEYVLTERDLYPAPARQYDAIAMGSYHIDIREVQRTWQWAYEHPDPIPYVLNEGYLSVPVRPYQIPYRCVVPRFADCTNLLVPVCVSASHVAFASIRMEPQYQMLGHAVGVAAALALRDNRPVQRVDVTALQALLSSEDQVLAL